MDKMSEGFLSEIYNEYAASKDRHVTKWFLMSSPIPLFSILFLYLVFVKVLGPSFMRHREPFNMRYIMFCYNLVVLSITTYFLLEILEIFRIDSFSLCKQHPLTQANEELIEWLGWVFILLKLFELLDTVFMVLRKKSRQMSHLHLIHHTIVPISAWIGFRVQSGRNNYFFPLLNCIAHVGMYAYYSLAVIGVDRQKYLWWKKQVTQFQLAQFLLALTHKLAQIWYGCKLKKIVTINELFLATLFLCMFINFYHKTYLTTARKTEPAAKMERNGIIVPQYCTNGSAGAKKAA